MDSGDSPKNGASLSALAILLKPTCGPGQRFAGAEPVNLYGHQSAEAIASAADS